MPPLLGAGQYMPKPISSDSLKTLNYLSGGFIKTTNDSDDDVLTLGQISFSKAHQLKKLNFAYGIDAYSGAYRNKFLEQGDADNFESKNISGLQLKTSVNTFKSVGQFELRLVGLELAYSKEFGDFARFRRDIPGRENFYSLPKTGLFSAGPSTELLWKQTRARYGFKLSLLNTFGSLDYQGYDQTGMNGGKARRLNSTIALYFQQKHFFIILEGLDQSGRLNFGFSF